MPVEMLPVVNNTWIGYEKGGFHAGRVIKEILFFILAKSFKKVLPCKQLKLFPKNCTHPRLSKRRHKRSGIKEADVINFQSSCT